MPANRIDGNNVWIKTKALNALEDLYLAECQVRNIDVSIGMNILDDMRSDAIGKDEVRITLKQYRLLNLNTIH